NPELGREALKIIFSEEFQTLIAEAGCSPGDSAYGDSVEGPFGEMSTAIVTHSKLTPHPPQWGVAMSNNVLRGLVTDLAQGNDVDATAEKYNATLQEILSADS